MADVIADLRAGLVANLSSLKPGVNVLGRLRLNVQAPAVMVELGPGEYDKTFGRGCDEWRFVIRCVVPFNDDQAAQDQLDAFLEPYGERSIKQLVESDPTLGGAADDLIVTGFTQPQFFTVANRSAGAISAPLWGSEVAVTVYARGKT